MISAPSSSRTSWVRPLTVAWVPTGMNTGVSIGPRGVVKRPQRAPVASVFAISKEKFIFDETPESRTGKNACPTSVYQEKINAQPTRQAILPIHRAKMPPDSRLKDFQGPQCRRASDRGLG